MEPKDIARIEQLRYYLSVATRNMLRARGPQRAAHEAELSKIKGELDALIARCPGYILIGKGHIEQLRERFLCLPDARRRAAIEGNSAEGAILDEMEEIFKQNYTHADAIAQLLCALEELQGPKEGIAKVLERRSDFCAARIGGPSAAIERFVVSARGIGLRCARFLGSVFLSSSSSFATFSSLEGMVEDTSHSAPHRPLWLQTSAPASAAERMRRILSNPVVKRWILGVFKDESEKEKYAVVQRTLAKLATQKGDAKGVVLSTNFAGPLAAPSIEVSAPARWSVRAAIVHPQPQEPRAAPAKIIFCGDQTKAKDAKFVSL